MKYYQEAIDVLHQCITENGFVASPIVKDNYARIWSRDSMIAGMASLLSGDAECIESFKRSVLFLSEHQNKFGQIPSNVSSDGNSVSFGSLVGRVDATSWWIIGACLISKNFPEYKSELQPRIAKAFDILEAWEFNGRGLIYTPLGGNWADEYVSQGYVLYDQLLRLWGLKLFADIFEDQQRKIDYENKKELVIANYKSGNLIDKNTYHPSAYSTFYNKSGHWASAFFPAGYDIRWDAAANALVLLLGLESEPSKIAGAADALANANTTYQIPVFSPVIKKEDPDWRLLSHNFSYQFKNNPHEFHNGGSWPVFTGLLSMGLFLNGFDGMSQKILSAQESAMDEHEEDRFTEYWNIHTAKPGGVNPLGFSAAGYIFMAHACSSDAQTIKNLWGC
jgi:GH15 family glucan-1,4-alpha-glucosidase